MFRPLLKKVGFGWTLRIIAFICLAVALLALAIIRPRASPNKPRRLFDWSAFREAKFNLYCASQVFLLVGAYIPFYYLALFAKERVGMSEDLSYSMLAVMSAGSIVGRFALGLAAVKYGVFPVFGFFMTVAGLVAFIWGSVDSVGGVVAFGFCYGFLAGGIAGLQPIAMQHLAPLHLIGTRSGMTLVFNATGVLVGNPTAGAILNSKAGFRGMQVFGGATLLSAGILVFLTAQAIQRYEREQVAARDETQQEASPRK